MLADPDSEYKGESDNESDNESISESVSDANITDNYINNTDVTDYTNDKSPKTLIKESKTLVEKNTDDDLRNWKKKVGTKFDVTVGQNSKSQKFKVNLAADRRAADMANGIDSAFKEIALKTAAKKHKKKEKRKQKNNTEEEQNTTIIDPKVADETSNSQSRDIMRLSVVKLQGSVTIDAIETYQPVETFSDLSKIVSPLISDACVDLISAKNPMTPTIAPTMIQSEMWGAALQNDLPDVIAISYTGSGKTLGYLVPVFNIITKRYMLPGLPGLSYPRGLIIAPTRELVYQITEVAQSIATYHAQHITNQDNVEKVVALSIVGGVGFEHQQSEVLDKSPSLIIATPGRLLGLCGSVSTSARQQTEKVPAVINLSRVQVVVLDEADKLIELNFEKDIMEIMTLVADGPIENYLSTDAHPQTILTSATWSDAVTKLSQGLLMPGCFKITINPNKNVVDDLVASDSITQQIEVLDHKKGAYREKRLLEILTANPNDSNSRVIVFVLYKKEAEHVSEILKKNGLKANCLHGDMSQNQRSNVVSDFRQGQFNILVATDIAARGLDIPEITTVINYSVGISMDHYIHRIGRTGRAGKKGSSYTFVMDFDRKFVPQLIQVLEKTRQEIPQELRDMGNEVNDKNKKKDMSKISDSIYTELTDDQIYELECRKENQQKQQANKSGHQKSKQKYGRGR